MRPSPLTPLLAAALAACQGSGAAPGPVEPEGYLGPTMALQAPARGAMLDLAGPVELLGQACDAVHPLGAATVAGAPVALTGEGACRAFAAELAPRVGLEVVRGEVVNGAGERGTLAQAFLASPAWFEADGPGAWAPSGLLLRLGQDLLDDGDRSTANDVATVVEAVLAVQDLEAAVGAVRVASPDADGDGHVDTARYQCLLYTVTNKRTGFEAWKDGPLTHRGITVDRLALADGGLSARLTVRGLRVPFGVTGSVDSGCLGGAQDTIRGDVRASAITVEALAAVGLDGAGAPAVAITSTSASLQGLDIDIALGPLIDWTGLGSLIGDAIEGRVRGQIQSAIRDALRDGLQERLARLVAGLGTLEASLAFPGARGGALEVASGLDLLDVTAERALLGVRVRVRPAAIVPRLAGARGAMRLGGALPDAAGLAGEALAVAIEDDVVNQVLHAAWLAGAFDRAGLVFTGGVAGATGTRVVLDLEAGLPPVVMPRRGGSTGVDVGWGELGFQVTLEGPGGLAHASGVAAVVVGLDGLGASPDTGTFRPVLSGAPEVAVQVTSVDWDHLPTTRRLTEGLLEGLLRSALSDLLEDAVGALPLPVIDLGRLDPDLPPIRITLDRPRDLRLERYHVVAGAVVAVP